MAREPFEMSGTGFQGTCVIPVTQPEVSKQSTEIPSLHVKCRFYWNHSLTMYCWVCEKTCVVSCRQHPFLLGDLDRGIARTLLCRAYSSTMSPYLTTSGSSSNGPHADEDTPVKPCF